MGRKKGAHTAAVSQRFVRGVSSRQQAVVSLRNSTRHDRRKAIFRAACKNELHVACRAVDSMNDIRKRSARCRACSKNFAKAPSSHEKRAYAMLDVMKKAFATEVFMFPSEVDQGDFGFKLSKHPFDILLVDSMLLIEIDGSQHFYDEHHGQCSAEQQYMDAIVNAAVLDEGRGLVRLHYRDHEEEWEATIRTALEHQKDCTTGFVHYSPSYNAENLP